MRDIFILAWTLGILISLGLVAYAIDDLHARKIENRKEADIDQELWDLIDKDK